MTRTRSRHRQRSLAVLVLIFFSHQIISAANMIDQWRKDYQHSLQINLPTQCPCSALVSTTKKPVKIEQRNHSRLEFLAVAYFPSHKEVVEFRNLPRTLSSANEWIVDAMRNKGYMKWMQRSEPRWEVPDEHIGQNRSLCGQVTLKAAGGGADKFYEQFMDVRHVHYVVHIYDAFADAIGFVGASCGYYQGKEGCETRWDDRGRNWWNACSSYLSSQHMRWGDLWDDKFHQTQPSKAAAQLWSQCSSKSLVPRRVERLFIITTCWDYNYHHFLCDSLIRLVRHVSFLQQHEDVFIQIKAFDKDPTSPKGTLKDQIAAHRMRSNLFALLKIDMKRVIDGPVLARQVYMPKTSYCSYSLLNPIEVRMLAKLLYHNAVEDVNAHHSRDSKLDNTQLPSLHQLKPPSAARKNLVVIHRYSPAYQKTYYSYERTWDNRTYELVVEAFARNFPDHNIVRMTPFRPNCLSCDILDYSDADVLVGIHGAGLTNMIFMPQHSVVFEIQSDFNDANMPLCGYYGTLAATNGQHHYLHSYKWNSHSYDAAQHSIAANNARQFYDYIQTVKNSAHADVGTAAGAHASKRVVGGKPRKKGGHSYGDHRAPDAQVDSS